MDCNAVTGTTVPCRLLGKEEGSRSGTSIAHKELAQW